MKNIWYIIIICYSLSFVQAQEPLKKTLIYDAFSYPDFGDGTTYKNFSLTYPLRESLDAELRWIYLDNGIDERLQIPLLLK